MTYDPELHLRQAVATAIDRPSNYVTRSALRSADRIIELLRTDIALLAILCHGHPAEGAGPREERPSGAQQNASTTGDQ